MSARRRLALAALLGLLAALAGCASAPWRAAPAPAAADARWAAHRDAVAGLAAFTVTGRVGIQRGSEGGGAKLRWRQQGPDSDLRIMAPLAQGSFRLQGDAGQVVLSAPDGKQYRAASFEALMAAHLGWSFPVEGARYWVRGIPDPRQPVEQLSLDGEGRLSDLAQAGWRISVLEYGAAAGTTLPKRLFLNAGDLKIRLAIDGWELPEGPM
ncbi:MAG TPA: lipoprotein insertase outer membrane protein LolB [Gammaproteobacteria bacterium]|nr:lipoprotein insertase outer membrane protein LolB [Gammaproteobacteria bacterium]